MKAVRCWEQLLHQNPALNVDPESEWELVPMPAGSPCLDLTPRKLPSSAVPPHPWGQCCPGDLSQPLGLHATTRYPLIAGLHLVVKAGRWQKPLQAASSLLKRPFGVRDCPGLRF